ncbi:MAG: PSD1 and planctomycete cytochrome C domain-containing protein [Gemmataceae bacterium]
MLPILLSPLVAAALAAGPDYRRDVLPILSEHCFLCHGPDAGARKGKLRLDVRADALKAIAPGKPEQSELIRRVACDDPAEVMPPPRAKNPVTAAQIEVLKRWVAGGAPYESHWAFLPPRRSAVPAGAALIDHLAARGLAARGLDPAPPAPLETLCRRLHLDLTGLPPTPARVEAFVTAAARGREAAVARLIDELLASPHFGERWAQPWLDAARYADSDGYEKDLPRQQWAYRDWVVRAINADLPYDRFLVEQLAGDLLPGATQDQVVATGFLRNSMINEEGAIIAEQFRKEAMFDRLDCVGKAVLGLTLQCAQCHTHKYDPITHHEYFGLFAFLNDTYEAQSWVYTDAQLSLVRAVRQKVAAADRATKQKVPDWEARLAAWERQRRAAQTPWSVLKPTDAVWGGGVCHPTPQDDGSVLTLGHKGVRGELTVTGRAGGKLTGLRLEALTHGDLPFDGPGRSPKGTFALAELEVEAADVKALKWAKVPVAAVTADVSPPARELEPIYQIKKDGKPDPRRVGPASFLADGKEDTGWCPDVGPGRRNVPSHAVLAFKTPVEHPAGTLLRVTLKFRHAGTDGYGRTNNFLGSFRLSTTAAEKPAADPYRPDVRAALEVPAAKRAREQAERVFEAWRVAEGDDRAALWAGYPEADTSVLTVARRRPEHARKTHLLDRGAWDRPKEVVPPGGLAALHPLPAGPADRLTFARWAASKDNPLTARVQVNRVWQTVWGAGLVETAEDFGTRVAMPEQRELLDGLAVEFMERGWSLKELLRTVLNSRAYQQSSAVTPAALEKDPKNRWLARGPRFRVDAETVRDIALAASGLLNPEVGGPYRFPPVPESLLSMSYAKVDFWVTAEGPQRYRRSLYTFRRRSLPDPLLACFDAPSGETAVARRGRSNTPLAALAGMNETVMVEAARALAGRVLREGGATDAERVAYAFRLCASRRPTDAESRVLTELLAKARGRLKEADVWTVAARVLLNLDETLTKG